MLDLLDEAQAAQRRLAAASAPSDLIDGVVLALSERDGWRLTGQSSDGTPQFEYEGTDVPFPHVTNVHDMLRSIMRIEQNRSVRSTHSNPFVQKVEMEILSDFDRFFEDCFESLRRTRSRTDFKNRC